MSAQVRLSARPPSRLARRWHKKYKYYHMARDIKADMIFREDKPRLYEVEAVLLTEQLKIERIRGRDVCRLNKAVKVKFVYGNNQNNCIFVCYSLVIIIW